MACALFAASASGQDATKREVSVHRFDAAPGPRNLFVTRTARSDGKNTFSVGVFGGFGQDPLVIMAPCGRTGECYVTDPDPKERDQPEELKVIKSVGVGEVIGSFTIIPRLQLGLRIPVVSVSGQGIDSQYGTMVKGGLKKTSLGDPMLEAKFRFYGDAKSPLAAGVAAFVTAPLGHAMAEKSYIGDASPDVGLRGIVDYRIGSFFAAANVAGLYRKNGIIGATKVGSEARYSVGAGYDLGILTVMAEGVGHTRFKTEGDGSNGLEALLGARVAPQSIPISFSVGGGARLIEGVGVPSMRVFGGVVYSAEPLDADGDGVLDTVDACPAAPEDRDGHEDSDGCPDDDNDGDRFNDAADKCPDQAEDLDGFEDSDGCPDVDNDKDGIPDERDACPLKPETKNGFKDDDGCPDAADADGDGVPDASDKCPAEPEDTDGFEDTDGCPDPDNDKDGVLDANDECSDEPETINEFEDTDGCPDEAPKADPKKK